MNKQIFCYIFLFLNKKIQLIKNQLNMNTIKDRLDVFLSSLKMSGQEFERKINASSGWYCRVVDNLSSTKKEAIAQTFPELNMRWLITGEGEMLLKQSSSVINITKNTGGNNAIGNDNNFNCYDADFLKQQAEIIQNQQNTISNLTQILLNITNNNK